MILFHLCNLTSCVVTREEQKHDRSLFSGSKGGFASTKNGVFAHFDHLLRSE